MIDGVHVTPLTQIADERGRIMHMLRADNPGFAGFRHHHGYGGKLLVNPHDPDEIGRMDPFDPTIPYTWELKHR